MEHLLLPHGVQLSQEDLVPFVASKREDGKIYDGGPFLEFLERNPSDLLTLGPEGRFSVTLALNPWLSEETKPFESLCQTWLFFGLLREILGDAFRENDFLQINRSKAPSCINTAKLITLLQDWKTPMMSTVPPGPYDIQTWNAITEKLSHGDVTDTMFGHWKHCLRITADLLTITIHIPNFNRNIRLSIASTAEVISQALSQAFDFRKVVFAWTISWDKSRWSRLNSPKGCPAEKSQTSIAERSLQALFYMSKLDRQDAVEDHASCSYQSCIASRQHLAHQQGPVHLIPKCNCNVVDMRGKALEDVITILSRNEIPVLRVDTESDPTVICVVPSTVCSTYTAISHVWVDGFGNRSGNALTLCRLKELSRVCRALDHEASKPPLETSSSFFWIDTLCVPRNDKIAKKIAITLMRQVYEQASRVLVLDAEVQALRYADLDFFEATSRFVTSRWTTRLWTLQEGLFARSLWVQFADGPRAVAELFCNLRRSDRAEQPNSYLVRAAILSRLSWMRRITGKPEHGFGIPTRMLWQTVRSRTTTNAEDEPLCISSLMNLNTGVIMEEMQKANFATDNVLLSADVQRQLEVDMAKEGMKSLWRLISEHEHADPVSSEITRGIPQEIIFYTGPRLKDKGWRWAPSTLLRPDDDPKLASPSSPAQIMPRGLGVTYPGFTLHAFSDAESTMRTTSRPFLAMSGPNETWYALTIHRGSRVFDPLGTPITGDHLYDKVLAASMEFALILIDDVIDKPREATQCLLVEILSRDADMIVVRSHGKMSCYSNTEDQLSAVEFAKKVKSLLGMFEDANVEPPPDLEDARATAHDYLTGQYAVMGERFSEKQRWCVD